MILKLLLAAGLIFITIKLFRKPVEEKNKQTSSNEALDLKEDPICKTFVEETTEYRVKYYDNMYYFCSKDCMDKFIESKKQKED